MSHEINAEIDEYAKMHDISTSEATQELLRAGLKHRRQAASAMPTDHNPQQKELEQRQQHIAHQQRQIIRFQKVAVGTGIGWGVLTATTGETGALWTALGMLIIVLLAASTYVWQYIPTFE